jgi:prepilin-type processing-associated H-X9-DG protein
VDDFTSRHTGGLNCLFADGSVHFISNNIDIPTWVALATRAGGEVVAGFDY